MNETLIAAALCSFLAGGDTETRADFVANGTSRHVRIDCETPAFAIELGFDGKSSNRDSVHQAIFGALMTGKRPAVILIDTDGVEGRYEYEMRRVTDHLGILYRVCNENHIIAWQMTSAFRPAGRDKSLDYLPRPASATGFCNLSALSSAE